MNIQDYAVTNETPAVQEVPIRSRFQRFLPLMILSGSVVGVFVMVALFKKPPENKPKLETARLVDTIVAQPGDIRFSVATYGTVQPQIETTMVAEVAGQVVQVSPAFVAGGFLRSGEVLLQIDPSDYQTALLSAEARLASNKAQLSSEQAQSEQARKDWNRLNPGREPNPLVLRIPQLDGAKAAVRSAEADVMKARRDLERTYIRMPYDGLVKARNVDLGQYVSPGSSVGDIFAVSMAEVRLPLSDDELRYLDLPKVGQLMGHTQSEQAQVGATETTSAVTLSANVGGEKITWQAQLARTEAVIDSSSRVIYAVAQVDDPYGLLGSSRPVPLKVGTFVSAEIQGKQASGIVTVPRSVLQPDHTLLIANADNKLEVRQVDVIRATPETAYIGGGLQSGELIITTSIAAPVPGIAIRTAQDTPGAESQPSEPAMLVEQSTPADDARGAVEQSVDGTDDEGLAQATEPSSKADEVLQ